MPSFDTVCDPDMVEVRNAVDNAAKEIGTRFDFKGTSAAIELKDKEITLLGDAEFQLQQVEDILRGKLTKRGYKTTYRMIANDNALGAALAIYAHDALKIKKVAVIDDRTAYGQGLADVFKATAKEKGIEVVAEEFTTDKATDFMAILTGIKAKKPDAVFFGGLDAQAGPMLRQLAQLGLTDVKFFGGDALCTEKLPELSSKAASIKNVTCATGGASIQKMQGGTAWKKKYDAKFPGQFQIYSPYAYDATFVLVDAMKRANSVDPKAYLPFIGKTKYKGVTANIAFTANGELTQPAVTLYVYKDNVRTALN